MAEAFFTPTADPDTFVATTHTQGPWTDGVQHGGPPSALLARAVELLPAPFDPTITRLTFEILGPVPVGEVSVAVGVERTGRSVELVEGALTAGGRVALRLRAWRIRTAEVDLPPRSDPAPRLPAEETPFLAPGWRRGYLDAMEWRVVSGSFEQPGDCTAWARMKVLLVDGEQPSAVQRVAAVADSTNGLSSSLDPAVWWFIPPETTVHLGRRPAGEWICVDARARYDPSGVGLAEGALYDLSGPIGRSAQALLVGRR